MLWSLLVVAACTSGQDTEVQLPPGETDLGQRETDPSTFPIDTAPDTDPPDSPPHLLTLHQWGTWDMSPSGGPYNSNTGMLFVQEYLDGNRPSLDTDVVVVPDTEAPITCDLTFTLSGPGSATTCDGCSAAFDITFSLAEGDPGQCHDPELPQDGEIRRFGFHDATGHILHDYGDLGLWLPWYPGTRLGDRVTYDWEATVGLVIEDTGQ